MSEFGEDQRRAGRLLLKAIQANASKKKATRHSQRGTQIAGDPTTDAIIQEMHSVGAIGVVEIHPTIDEHKWTETLPGFEAARDSALRAVLQLSAETQALRCSFQVESPHIEQSLFQIRAGLITADDERLQALVAHAQRVGRGREIFQRIAESLRDSERRKNDGTMLPDLNDFRLTIAGLWIGFLFWLMSDENIARFIVSNRLAKACNPASITKARKELRLVKSSHPVVKGVGPKFCWTFKAGYPPADQ